MTYHPSIGAVPSCPECGHPTYFHRSNLDAPTMRLDSPVPCFARHVSGDTYVVCGCLASMS